MLVKTNKKTNSNKIKFPKKKIKYRYQIKKQRTKFQLKASQKLIVEKLIKILNVSKYHLQRIVNRNEKKVTKFDEKQRKTNKFLHLITTFKQHFLIRSCYYFIGCLPNNFIFFHLRLLYKALMISVVQ